MSFTLFETAVGTCGIAWSDEGVLALQLPEETRGATRERLLKQAPRAAVRDEAPAPKWVRESIATIVRHLEGDTQDLSKIRLDLSHVSEFHRKVYEAARVVPSGTRVTYAELAKRAGSTNAARAVGRAMATNPIAILVPCHRVVGAGAAPGGFSAWGGLDTKERLLRIEGASLGRAASLFDGVAPELPFDGAEAVRVLSTRDAKLGRLMDRVGPLRLKVKDTESVFAALAESIVYQQLTGKAARTIFDRVRALSPKRFDAARVSALSDEALRGAGLSRSKVAAVRDLAERSIAGEIPTMQKLARMDDEAIVERLSAVRGIGRWTVQMLLIFRLGRPDVLPIDDYGVRKGFARAMKKRDLPTPQELAKYGERWAPFRTVASWYLWRATELPE